MTSNPSFSRFGVEAMSSYFMTNSSMISADAPSFHPNMPPDGSVSFADPVIGGAADIGTHFMANNMMLTSLASQLFCTNPLQGNLNIRTSSQNMNGAYVASDSCSTAHPLLQFSPSDGMIVQPSKKVPKLNGDPQCDWGYIGSSTMSVHDSYNYDTGFSDAAFAYLFSAGSAVTSELSLSLCSKSSSISMVNAPDQSSEVSCSALTHVNSKDISFRQPPYNDVGVDAELVPMYPQMCSRPMHFSDVLARSRYTHIAQQVLNDVVGHVLQGVADIANPVSGIESEARPSLGSRCSMMAASTVSSNQLMASCEEHPRDGADAQKLRNELLNMLHLMDQRYNQCLDEVQSTAAKYSHLMQPSSCAPFAHHAVSAAYRSLRKRVTGAITLAAWGPGRGEASASEKDRTSWESSFIQKHWALQQLRRGDQQSWRPQRGLPEKSVAVLKSWMLENFLRPYPKDNEKEMLAARSGLSRSQVSNWFINARVRLWKPMIEEMYEELKKNSGSGGGEGLAAVERRSCEDAAIS